MSQHWKVLKKDYSITHLRWKDNRQLCGDCIHWENWEARRDQVQPVPFLCRMEILPQNVRNCASCHTHVLPCSTVSPPPTNTSLSLAVFKLLLPLPTFLTTLILPGTSCLFRSQINHELFCARLRRSKLICFFCSGCDGLINHNGIHFIRTYT